MVSLRLNLPQPSLQAKVESFGPVALCQIGAVMVGVFSVRSW